MIYRCTKMGNQCTKRNCCSKPNRKRKNNNREAKSCSRRGDPSPAGPRSAAATATPRPSSSSDPKPNATLVKRMSTISDNALPLNFGSINETWKNKNEWNRFVDYLKTMQEGEDSDGSPMLISRYATFLQLYAALDQGERVQVVPDPELKAMVMDIANHVEDFFGTERCLRCIDKGMRRQVLDNLKKVRRGDTRPGTWVYQPVYPRVLDKLNECLGSYNVRSS